MRRIAVTTLVAVLGAAACASTDPDDATSTTRPATVTQSTTPGDEIEAVVDDRAPGVSDAAIKIGLTYPDFEALGDAVNINHGDYEAAYTAVIDDINARGGIHGRRLDPVIVAVNPADATSTDATCTQLTQDEEVFVAMGLFFADSVMCYVDVNETAVIGGEMTDERLSQANAPWFAYDLSSDAQVDGVETLIGNGDLSGTIAVLIIDQDEPLYRSRIEPILDQAGIDVAEVGIVNSSLDAEQIANESRTIFQRFEVSGAPTVLALGQGTASMVSDGLTGSSYRPQMVFNSTNGVNAFARDETRDVTVFEGATAVGVYGPPDAFLELDGVTEACFSVQRAAGITIPKPSTVAQGDPNQVVSSLAACQQLGLLVAILEAAGEDLDYGTFTTAGYRLGPVELPGEPEPFTFGPPPHSDGDRPQYRYVFDVSARQFAQVA